MTGPGIANFDLSFVKLFYLDETRHFQFRAEFFNMFQPLQLRPARHRGLSKLIGRSQQQLRAD